MSKGGAYQHLVRPVLFSLDPEAAHDFAICSLRTVSNFPPGLAPLRIFQPPSRPRKVFGLTFPNPIGLAAGLDKNGVALPAWEALGFGFIEIGTVTARPQPGNPKPRIFRLPSQEALINRLGFNNDGADVVAWRLRELRERGRWPEVPVGINIGKSKMTPLETAADDYLYSYRQLAEFASYVVLNVSSPNTPGLRSLQEKEALAALLRGVRHENQSMGKPVLLKISPDLSPQEVEKIAAICDENEMAGIIATNTTVDHGGIPPATDQTGGLSGRPLREKSTAMVQLVRSHTQLPIIASGGVADVESAREKFEAGADLIQVYTGYIYRGPGLLREIVQGLEF